MESKQHVSAVDAPAAVQESVQEESLHADGSIAAVVLVDSESEEAAHLSLLPFPKKMDDSPRAEATPLKLDIARKSYADGDVEASKNAHDSYKPDVPLNNKEKHIQGSDYLKDIIYGGLDGILEQFAVVNSVLGAGLGPSVAILLGVATLFADAFAMGIGDYLSGQAEQQFAKSERQRERWECDNYLEGEKKEMVELYVSKGLTEEDAIEVVDIISKDKDRFVDFMMVEELGILPEDEDSSPVKAALMMFSSFIGFGTVPILAFALASISGSHNIELGVTVAATVITLFVLGVIMGRMTGKNQVESGLTVVANGAVAGAAAYLLGWGLNEAFPSTVLN